MKANGLGGKWIKMTSQWRGTRGSRGVRRNLIKEGDGRGLTDVTLLSNTKEHGGKSRGLPVSDWGKKGGT